MEPIANKKKRSDMHYVQQGSSKVNELYPHVHIHIILIIMLRVPCWIITSPALAFEVNMASKISLQEDNVTNLYKHICTSIHNNNFKHIIYSTQFQGTKTLLSSQIHSQSLSFILCTHVSVTLSTSTQCQSIESTSMRY